VLVCGDIITGHRSAYTSSKMSSFYCPRYRTTKWAVIVRTWNLSKSPFSSAGTAVSLFRAKMVQERPQLPREVETRLPDCGVTH